MPALRRTHTARGLVATRELIGGKHASYSQETHSGVCPKAEMSVLNDLIELRGMHDVAERSVWN